MTKQQRLSANITIGGVVENSLKNGVGLIRSGFDKIGDSLKTVKKRQKELTRERQDLLKQGKSVAHLDREYKDLERTLEQLETKQRRWERAMRDSKRVGDTFGKMSNQIGRTSRRLGAGLAASAAGVFALANSTASYGDNVAKTAGKLGIGIEALQEYRYAAERSGISNENFDSSLTAMQKRLGEAVRGTGAAKKALDQLGLSAGDLIDMGPEAALELIADRIAKVEKPAERAALAAALFSRSGIGMVNMLGGGSEALKQLREDARKTGYVLSEKAARDAEAFADAQLDAQLTIKGLKNTIGAEFMPVVTRSMKQFSGWAVSNRADIKAFAETATTKLEAALPVVLDMASGIGKVSSEIGNIISKTAEFVGGWENLGVIVGGVFASRTVMSVVTFGAAVGRLGVSLAALTGVFPVVAGGVKAIGAALMANPIGLAVGAIAGGAYLIYKNWETIGPWFSDLIGGVVDTFMGLGTFVGGLFRGDMDAAADGLKTSWGGVKRGLSTYLGGIGSVFKATWENVIKPVTDALGATDAITSAWGNLKTSIGTVVDYLAERFEWLMQKLSPVLDGLSWIRDKGAGAVAGVQGLGSGLRNWWNGDSEESAPKMPGQAIAGQGQPKHISGSYLGGDIGKGPRHVGEQGPETIWPSKGLYVAHAGATERLAQLSDKAAPLVGALGSGLKRVMAQAHSAAAPAMVAAQTVATPALQNVPAQMPAEQAPAPIIIHAHINAAHLDAEQIAEALEARARAAQTGALYDDVHSYGQYEGT